MRLGSPNSDRLTLSKVNSNNKMTPFTKVWNKQFGLWTEAFYKQIMEYFFIYIALDHSPCTATTVRCMEKQSNTQHSFAHRIDLQFTTATQIKVKLERLLPPKPCRPAFNGFDWKNKIGFVYTFSILVQMMSSKPFVV